MSTVYAACRNESAWMRYDSFRVRAPVLTHWVALMKRKEVRYIESILRAIVGAIESGCWLGLSVGRGRWTEITGSHKLLGKEDRQRALVG